MPRNDASELQRYRSLVGPSERSYREIQDNASASLEQARQATHDAGRLRGELQEMSVELARARQEQDRFQRRRSMSASAYVADLGRECWSEICRPALGRLTRALHLRDG